MKKTHGEGHSLDGADGVAAVARVASSAEYLMAIHGSPHSHSLGYAPITRRIYLYPCLLRALAGPRRQTQHGERGILVGADMRGAPRQRGISNARIVDRALGDALSTWARTTSTTPLLTTHIHTHHLLLLKSAERLT